MEKLLVVHKGADSIKICGTPFQQCALCFMIIIFRSMAPDYHQVIKEPMDFSTMRSKIEANEYEDVAAFRKDVELVVNNALTYNQPNTIYNVAAQKLDQIVRFYFSEPHLRYLFHTLPFCKVSSFGDFINSVKR